ncbi:MAG: hypothetical protein K2K22_03665 [Muribaculaceae bacterium]|nr:hypothetical protein [Muribaculaceae bacterium]
MKILLLGDASNYHVALAKGLRSLGHDVTVASNGSKWMQTPRDIDLFRRDHMLGGAILYARMSTVLAGDLRGYDVVQLVSPGFVDLRPALLARLLRRLRKHNGALYLSALGTDAAFVRNLTGPRPALDFSEWSIDGELTPWAGSAEAKLDRWMKPVLQRYNELFYNTIDGVVSALYEYHKVIEAEYPGLPLAYGGIPVDRDALQAPRLRPEADGPLKVLYAVHRSRVAEKGADKLLDMLRRLEKEIPGAIEIVAPPNMPYGSFTGTLAQADIVCDQLYSYTPATTALLGMAMGVVPISGGEEVYYDFIGERDLRPVFNPDPRDLEGTYRRLRDLLTDREAVRRMSAEGPLFIARHNDAVTVARRFVDFWTSI